MHAVSMRVTCPAAPVQIEGSIGGVPFYFRARHDQWEFGAGDDPVDITIDAGAKGGFYRTGTYDPEDDGHGASWMGLAVAEEIVRSCLAEFERERGTERATRPCPPTRGDVGA